MYEIILYDTEDERCPVQELLDSLKWATGIRCARLNSTSHI